MYPRPKVGRLADRALYQGARCREGLRRGAPRTTEALGTRENPLLFRAGLTSGDDEDEEAHKERREQGKALSAARTDPHGYLAIQRAALL